MKTLRKRAWLAALVVFGLSSILAGCGNSGNGAAANALTIVRSPSETNIPIPSLSRGTRVVALQSDQTDVAVAWVQGTGIGKSEVVAQLLNEDLQKIGDEERVSDLSEDILDHLGLCHSAGGWNAIWSDTLRLDLITTTVTLDTANVQARWSWPPIEGGVIQVNTNDIGAQSNPEIACLADGQRVATWSNVCIAARRVSGGISYFVPLECATEPDNGSYLQLFSSDGDPEGEIVALPTATAESSRVPVASLGSGQFVLLAGSTIQARSDSGDLLDEHVESDVDFSSAVLTCASTLCAAAVATEDALRIWLIDPMSLESTSSITVASSSQPEPNRTLRPVDASIACDSENVCVVSWLLLGETLDGDVVFSESEGTYARAFRADSGELGPEVMIFAPESPEERTLLAAQADSTFVTARVTEGLIAIGQLQVE